MVGPPLLGDRVGGAEPRRERPCLLGEARVGCDDDEIGQRLGGDRLAQDRHRVEIVDRHVEEALELRRVQVHGDHAVDARALDRVGAHPGADRDPGLVLLVALRVAEVRDHGGDRRRAGALERVDPEQQLHEVVVGGERRALHQEGVPAADVLEHPHEEVAFGEPQRLAGPERATEVLGDRRAEADARRAGEEQELVVHVASLRGASVPRRGILSTVAHEPARSSVEVLEPRFAAPLTETRHAALSAHDEWQSEQVEADDLTGQHADHVEITGRCCAVCA